VEDSGVNGLNRGRIWGWGVGLAIASPFFLGAAPAAAQLPTTEQTQGIATPPSLELLQEQTLLQAAVCAQNWERAMQISDRILSLDNVSATHRENITQLRSTLEQLAAQDLEFEAVPNCPGSPRTQQMEWIDLGLFHSALERSHAFVPEKIREVSEEMGDTHNIQMALGICDTLTTTTAETPQDFFQAIVDRNFFGLPLFETDTLEDFQEENFMEMGYTLGQYIFLMGVLGTKQLCPENTETLENILDMDF